MDTKVIGFGIVFAALALFGILGGGSKEEPTTTGTNIPPAVVSASENTVSKHESVMAGAPVVSLKSLELLGPVYSEKGIFQDGTIYVAFDSIQHDVGIASAVGFWLHNTSADVINVLWDRCSMQLPDGDTVGVFSGNMLEFDNWQGTLISVAPGGDLFDEILPVSEVTMTEELFSVSYDVLNTGISTLVLAIERQQGGVVPSSLPHAVMPGTNECDEFTQVVSQPPRSSGCSQGREVVYYTFRFVIR